MEYLNIIVIAMLPLSELRGAIPYAAYLNFNPIQAYLLAIIGNFLPVPFIFYILHKIELVIIKVPFLNKTYKSIIERINKKRRIVEKYGYLGLTLFVAIPLPITGAWTGSLLAFLMKLDKFRSMLFIFLGIILAGLIVTILAYGIKIVIFT